MLPRTSMDLHQLVCWFLHRGSRELLIPGILPFGLDAVGTQDRLGPIVTLPIEKEVVSAHVGLVAHRDEGRYTQVELARPLQQRDADRP